eukprot:c37506_g1_i1 orf=45-236(+)
MIPKCLTHTCLFTDKPFTQETFENKVKRYSKTKPNSNLLVKCNQHRKASSKKSKITSSVMMSP